MFATSPTEAVNLVAVAMLLVAANWFACVDVTGLLFCFQAIRSDDVIPTVQLQRSHNCFLDLRSFFPALSSVSDFLIQNAKYFIDHLTSLLATWSLCFCAIVHVAICIADCVMFTSNICFNYAVSLCTFA